MKKVDINQAIALLANIGVIVSLVFVGEQVRQSAQATRTATIFELKNAWLDVNLALATNPDLAMALTDVNASGWEASASVSKIQVGAFYRSMIHNWSTGYYQYRQGTLDDEQWAPYLRQMKIDARDPVMRRIWSDWRFIYDDEFQALVDGYMAKAANAAAAD